MRRAVLRFGIVVKIAAGRLSRLKFASGVGILIALAVAATGIDSVAADAWTMGPPLSQKPAFNNCGGADVHSWRDLGGVAECMYKGGYFLSAYQIGRRILLTDFQLSQNAQGRATWQAWVDRAAQKEAEASERPDVLRKNDGSCETEQVARRFANLKTGDLLDSSDFDTDAWAQELAASPGVQIDTSMCYFRRHDWSAYVRVFDQLDFSKEPYPETEKAIATWREALALEGIGDIKHARIAIRRAYTAINKSTPGYSQVAYDYNRFGAAKEDAIAKEFASRRIAKQAAALQRVETASYNQWLSTLSVDMQAIAKAHGEPCNSEQYDTATFHEITWWYCDASGDFFEAYTFIGGKLSSHYRPFGSPR